MLAVVLPVFVLAFAVVGVVVARHQPRNPVGWTMLLAAAGLLNPLRLRVQHLVDRRFNRARYDTDTIVAAFTLRLRDAVDLDTVRHELLAAVDGAVQPAYPSVWIRPPGCTLDALDNRPCEVRARSRWCQPRGRIAHHRASIRHGVMR